MIKKKSISLIDWCLKYNIYYQEENNRLYLYVYDLVRWTKSQCTATLLNKIPKRFKVTWAASDLRYGEKIIMPVKDAIEVLKRYDVIKEFPTALNLIDVKITSQDGIADNILPVIENVTQIGDKIFIELKLINNGE
jgi:hypothetical protein